MLNSVRRKVIKETFEEVIIRGECDWCGKQFCKVGHDLNPLKDDRIDDGIYDYYQVTAHHHNWGNDSVESYESKQYCSIDCVCRGIENYWQEKRDNYNIESDTYKMEIEHKYVLGGVK